MRIMHWDGIKTILQASSVLADKTNLLHLTGKWDQSIDKTFQALKIVYETHKALHGLKAIPKDEE